MARRPLFVLLAAFGSSVAFACSAPAADDAATGSESAYTSCESGRSGYDCSVSGQMCKDRCYPTDERKDAFVSVNVAGKALDSRAVPFDPVLSLDHVIEYGCDLWDFSDKTHQGLGIQYEKLIAGAFTTDQKSDFEDKLEVYVPRFLGPGQYTADARFVASDEDEAAGRTYAQGGACSVTMDSDGSGGVKGTFSCPSIASKTGMGVAMNGEFACPGSAMDPIFSRYP